MGNSNGTLPRRNFRNVPPQYFNGKPRVLGSVNGYNYYPPQYAPQPYGPRPYYPSNRPVLSSDRYLQNEFFGQPQLNDPTAQQPPPIQQPPLIQQLPPIQEPPPIQPPNNQNPDNTKKRSHHHRRHHHHHHRHHDDHKSDTSTQSGHQPHHHHHHHHVPVAPHINHLHPNHIATAHPITTSPSTRESVHLTAKSIAPVTNMQLTTPRSENYSTPIPVKQDPPPIPVTARNSELTPVLVTNHVVNSTAKRLPNNLRTDTLSISKRTQSQNVEASRKWYDHDYDKRIKTLTINNV